MQSNETNAEVLKIRSLNKIAYLKSKGVTQIDMYIEQDASGKNRVTYCFEATPEIKSLLDKYYLNDELKNVLKEFVHVKNEMYGYLKELGD